MFESKPIPKPVVPTAATPYDPKAGPVIRPEHWTPEMLAAPLTQSLLANQVDPAAFINKRRSIQESPSPAVVVTEFNGTVHSVAPVLPTSIASADEVGLIFAHLLTLGMDGTVPITESPLGGGAQRVEWNGETRRKYMIGTLNVGNLALRYAVTPDLLADAATKAELQAAGMLR